MFILLLMSDIIPWSSLQDLPVFSFFRSFQFVWRFNMLVILLLSLCAAEGFSKLLSKQTFLYPFLLLGCLLFSFLFYRTYLPQTRVFTDDNMPLQTDSLYLFEGNDCSSREPFESNGRDLSVDVLSSRPTLVFNYSVSAPSEGEGLHIDVPLNYYPGYVATVNGITCKTIHSDTGIVRVPIPENASSGTVEIRYRESVLYLATDILSLLSFLCLIFFLARSAKRGLE